MKPKQTFEIKNVYNIFKKYIYSVQFSYNENKI